MSQRNAKSAYRRELEDQAEADRAKREREKAELRAEKFNDFGDPMKHLKNKERGSRGAREGGGGGGGGGYSPSVYEDRGGRRRGEAVIRRVFLKCYLLLQL